MNRPWLHSISLLIRGTATPVTLYYKDVNRAESYWKELVRATGSDPIIFVDEFGTSVHVAPDDIACKTWVDYVAIGQAQVTMEFMRRESLAAVAGLEQKMREEAEQDKEVEARVAAELARRQAH